MVADLLAGIAAGRVPAFALLHRAADPRWLTVLAGRPTAARTLADLALPDPIRPDRPDQSTADSRDLLVAIPYRQIVERGLACHDDRTPLLALRIAEQVDVPLAEATAWLPAAAGGRVVGRFDPADPDYARTVRRVVDEQIAQGAGANFVIRRAFRGTVGRFGVPDALAVFGRLLAGEHGAYWTFLVHCGGITLLGATPERHVSLVDGVATMTPISGTYRYPSTGPTRAGLLGFLADGKESDELCMVVDEELKMMARVCREPPRLTGPYLREMARLAHTEYAIAGRTDLAPLDLLRATMFAPTVVGSPLPSACRVITEYEPDGRGYYAGVLALVGHRLGRPTLDSAILIRTAEVRPDATVEIGVGATLVRHSDPDAEVAETRAKAATLLAAFDPAAPVHRAVARTGRMLRDQPLVQAALTAHGDRLSVFWRSPQEAVPADPGGLTRVRILVVDAEDDFTAMLAHLLRALGPAVRVVPVDRVRHAGGADVVVLGPGPGDPGSRTDPRVLGLRRLAGRLLADRTPTLAVCLGHQVLAGVLGLAVRRRPEPNQGIQRRIVIHGQSYRVGCYNSFAAYADRARLTCPVTGDDVTVHRELTTGEVVVLSKPTMRSAQFHPESVLTEDGPGLLRMLLAGVLTPDPHGPDSRQIEPTRQFRSTVPGV
jgi:2-amino-4-deoxychorismate synthase